MQRLVLTFLSNTPTDVIFDYLTDMQKYALVHPVITKIDQISEHAFLVYKTVPLGLLKFSFTYPVTVDCNRKTMRIVLVARIMKMVSDKMEFRLYAEKGRTRIEEIIQFYAVQPLPCFMKKIFFIKHKVLFENIERNLM